MQDSNEKKPRKTGSGGARKGTGPKTEMPKVTRSFTIDQDLSEWIDTLPGDKIKSATVNTLLRDFKNSMGE